MGDQLVSVFALIITGGIAIRILTNKNSADVIGTIFHGTAEDISASFGS
jgi:hypothetical protein